MIQAINSIVPTRSTFVNDLAFESYQQVKKYAQSTESHRTQIIQTSRESGIPMVLRGR
jgi:hypothetical protein